MAAKRARESLPRSSKHFICRCLVAPAAGAGPARATAARPTSRTAAAVPDAALQALTAQMTEMKLSVEGLEKERDFYFNKVRPPLRSCGRRGGR